MVAPKNTEFSRGITFDDVLLVPQEGKFLPRDAQTDSFLTPKIKLGIPFEVLLWIL